MSTPSADMKPGTTPALRRPRGSAFIALAAVGLALVEASIDAVTWVELDVAAIYGLPPVLAALTRSPRLLWTLAAALTATTFAVYAAQIPADMFALSEVFFVNRALDAVALLLAAGLLHAWIISVDTVEAQARLLQAQNEELECRRREAEEASARKTQLLASASHDIRTPVNTINLIARVIRHAAEDPALAAQVPRLAQRLQANASSLADLLSTVLDNAHLESGRVEYRESTFSLNTMLASSCNDLAPAARAKALQLDIEVPQRPIWLRTDRMKLQRVISNLVSNAIKFTPHGGVTVTAALTPDRVATICVQDTGIGIDPQQLEAIFTEFARVRRESDGNIGWGLGLAICRRLVKLIGGRITVESKLDQGTVFEVRLPPECVIDEPDGEGPVALQMEVAAIHEPAAPPPPTGRSITV
jgi:signal transduction histidine kinase